MPKPQIILRKKAVREKYIPLSETQLDDEIKRGALETVPISARAIGITLQSVIEYQRRVMGLSPLPDDAPEEEPHFFERNGIRGI